MTMDFLNSQLKSAKDFATSAYESAAGLATSAYKSASGLATPTYELATGFAKSVYKSAPDVATPALGVAVSAGSHLAGTFLTSSVAVGVLGYGSIAQNFLLALCGAGTLAGVVISVYSTVQLCKKVTSDESVGKNLKMVALGALALAVIQAFAESFLVSIPSFSWRAGHSMAYVLGANLAALTTTYIGLAAVVFTACAAYRTAVSCLYWVQSTTETRM